jgi:hypothetical protein
MANLQPKRLYTGASTGSNVYTVSSNVGSYAIIRNINACNTTTSNKSFTIHIIASGGSAQDSNKILSNINVPGDDVVVSDGTYILNAGDSVYLSQAAANVTVTISGVEYVA